MSIGGMINLYLGNREFVLAKKRVKMSDYQSLGHSFSVALP